MKTVRMKADIKNLDKAMAFLEEELIRAGADQRPAFQLKIALEELFVNIAHYAYKESGDVEVGVGYGDGVVTVSLSDSGVPFDPFTQAKVPDITLSADERPIGGLGVFVVKKSMDEYSYRYENGKNIVTIRKKVHNVDPR